MATSTERAKRTAESVLCACRHGAHTRARTIAAPGGLGEHERMSTVDPDDGTSSGEPAAESTTGPQDGGEPAVSPADQAPAKRRTAWIWLSVLLAIVAAGLLIWALTIQSDLDGTEQELASTQQELASTRQELDSTQQELDATRQDVEALEADGDAGNRTGAVLAGGAALYKEFAEQLGATEEDLSATQQELEEAEKSAAQAEQDAEAAKQAAADAGNETEKAKAEADQAKAEAKAAESKAAIAAECAKAYIAALSPLFEGESADDQAPAVRAQLSDITAACKDELAGT